MRITSVEIKGYRSLYDVTVLPGDLTVLTGKNNSGKTNFVEAIDFLAEVYRYNLESAISRKGGIENIFHRRMARSRRSMSFEVKAVIDSEEIYAAVPHRQSHTYIHITHQFEVGPFSQKIAAEYKVNFERLSLTVSSNVEALDINSKPFFIYLRDLNGAESRFDKAKLSEIRWMEQFSSFYERDIYGQLPVRPNDLITSFRFNPIEGAFVRAMSNIRLYQLVPLECRRPGVPAPNAEVERHGGNLPALVEYLKTNHKSSWGRVITSMQSVVPELVDIRTEFTPDRRLALQFVERGVRRPWSAEDISDGTIHALGMYMAIFDPRASLILFEEPENSLHSWIIRNFIDACHVVSDRQIILTTHSAVLLSYLSPAEVSLVWKSNGQTQIEPLSLIDPSIAEMWGDGSLTIFEVLDSGLLPQAVPGGDE
jgi:predicted ATPase